MKYLTKSTIQSASNECILAAIFEDRQLSETAEQLNSQLNNEISDLVANGEITGKIGQVKVRKESCWLGVANQMKSMSVSISKLFKKPFRQ